MKRPLGVLFLVCLLYSIRAYCAEETLQIAPFGQVTLYRQKLTPAHVVLFVSGDGGWNLGVVGMARELSSLNALVVGIDIRYYLKHQARSPERCSYAAADFETLSKYVQKSLNFPQYIIPILVGYSSGATLVYATIVQAPPNTFAGAISMGFCPDLRLTKPFCKGYGLQWESGLKRKGFNFLPARNLQVPWIAFNGTVDRVCNSAETSEYVKQVTNGRLILLPKVGHGFGVSGNWMPQFRRAFSDLTKNQKLPMAMEKVHNVEQLTDLPLVELPSRENGSNLFAIIVTGDGGWAGIDREIGTHLARQGVGTVGFNSLQYFWTPRTAEEAGKDLARIMQHYLSAWHKEKTILIGYSLGANVLPFMVDRLPASLLSKVKLVSLLGPSQKVEFQFHLTDWLVDLPGKNAQPVLPEVEKLKGTKMVCFYGKAEKNSLCTMIASDLATVVALDGGHHFGGDYQAIAEKILDESK